MKAHSDIADELGDMLGKHHDLEVFRQRLTGREFGDATDVEFLVGLVRRRQKAIEEGAFSIGARLFAEPAGSLTDRWQSYWDAWRADTRRDAALAA